MNERPPQPPEGKLIADATAMRGLSIREASSRAGISYGRWRQITSGVQNVSPGSHAAVRAPAATIARMAHAVGITPERLGTEGQRPDAAEILREILRTEPSAQPPALRVASSPAGDDPDDEMTLTIIEALAAQRHKSAKMRLDEIWEVLDRERKRAAGPAERNGSTG